MNIAINTLALYKTKTGMGRYIVELIGRVPKEDNQTTFFVYLSKKNKKYFDLSQENIIVKKVSWFWSFPFFKILWEQIFLPFSLWKNNIKLYHAPGFTLPLWKPNNTRFVVTIADMTFFSHPEYHTWWKVLYFQSLIPFSLKKADAIITISKNTKEDILQMQKIRISKEKIHAIPLGVDEHFTVQKEKNSMSILKKYQITTPYILFVGMLEPRKNVVGLIEAFVKISNKKMHKLVIVGKKGWKYHSIFQKVKELHLEKEVIFVGYVPDEDLPALYNTATCFVYPSFYEGFGIPVLEAMACRCPVITSKNSSLEEIGGDAAIFVNPYNIKTIKEAMELLLNDQDERKKRQNAGLLQVQKFSWTIMAKKTKEIYVSLLNL